MSQRLTETVFLSAQEVGLCFEHRIVYASSSSESITLARSSPNGAQCCSSAVKHFAKHCTYSNEKTLDLGINGVCKFRYLVRRESSLCSWATTE